MRLKRRLNKGEEIFFHRGIRLPNFKLRLETVIVKLFPQTVQGFSRHDNAEFLC